MSNKNFNSNFKTTPQQYGFQEEKEEGTTTRGSKTNSKSPQKTTKQQQKKRKSRRIQTRLNNRRTYNNLKPILLDNSKGEIIYNASINNHRNLLFKSYSFFANLNFDIYANEKHERMKQGEYFNKANKMQCHNLCKYITPPVGLGNLLGLGLKFCIQEPHPNIYSSLNTFNRFKRDIRIKYVFNKDEVLNNINPKIYVTSKWIPPHAPSDIDNNIKELQNNIKQGRDKIMLTPNAYNLSRHQRNLMNSLRQNNELIILNCDKKLGPAVM